MFHVRWFTLVSLFGGRVNRNVVEVVVVCKGEASGHAYNKELPVVPNHPGEKCLGRR